GDPRNPVGEKNQRKGKARPQRLDHEVERGPDPGRKSAAEFVDVEVGGGSIGDREREEDDPDVAEDLGFLAPAGGGMEDAAVKELQQPEEADALKEERHQPPHDAVDQNEAAFHAALPSWRGRGERLISTAPRPAFAIARGSSPAAPRRRNPWPARLAPEP